MPLKNIDFLSPKIALFYYGRRRHSATFGGILTILMILSCFAYIFYLFLDLINHSLSTFQYYRHFFKDPGIYLFNNTDGIFHFFQFYNPKNNSYFGKYNSKYIHLFMTNSPDDYKENSTILSEQDHWVYDNCRDGIDNSYFDKNIFANASFKDGICLRYYYNKIYKKYYPIEDTNNFIYPHLANIELNMNYSIATVIQKCDNNSLLTKVLGLCDEEKNINEFLKVNSGLNLNVLEHEINPENYTNQIYYFNYGISNILQQEKIIENNIIFVPLKTDIKGGIFFPKRKQKITYSFYDYYRRDEENKDNHNKTNIILSTYNFCLSPSGFVFKSDYETLYDCFPKMGGIIQLIYYIFFGINFLYNRFTIINDTKRLFFQLNNNDRANRNLEILLFSRSVYSLRRVGTKKFKFDKNKSKIDDSKIIHYSNVFNHFFTNSNIKQDNDVDNVDNSKDLSIFPDSSKKVNKFKSIYNMNDIVKIKSKKKNKINEELYLSISGNKDKTDNSKNNKENINDSNDVKDENEQKEKISENKENNENKKLSPKFDNQSGLFSPIDNNTDKDVILFKILLQKYFSYKKKSFIYEKTNLNEINKHFSFSKYIYSSFCFKKAKKYHVILDKFRKKLLSEEHFFRTHNYLYLFEKCFDIQESQKIDIVELYKNL